MYRVVIKPLTNPVTVQEVMTSARIDNINQDVTFEPYLNTLIMSATQHAEMLMGRPIITQTIECEFMDFSRELRIPAAQSIVSVKYLDSVGLEHTINSIEYGLRNFNDYSVVESANGYSFPNGYNVKIQAVAGFGNASDVPEQIKDWIMLRVKQRYDQNGMSSVGPSISEYSRSFADSLLDRYVIRHFA